MLQLLAFGPKWAGFRQTGIFQVCKKPLEIMGFGTHTLVWEVERHVGGGLEMLQILALRRNGAFSWKFGRWSRRKCCKTQYFMFQNCQFSPKKHYKTGEKTPKSQIDPILPMYRPPLRPPHPTMPPFQTLCGSIRHTPVKQPLISGGDVPKFWRRFSKHIMLADNGCRGLVVFTKAPKTKLDK